MTLKPIVLTLATCAVAWPAQSLAQQQQASVQHAEFPLLTLDDAVSLALKDNRPGQNSSLEAERFEFRLSTIRIRRLPLFQFAVLGSELLRSFDFPFPTGAFDMYPSIGPVPSPSLPSSPSHSITPAEGVFA